VDQYSQYELSLTSAAAIEGLKKLVSVNVTGPGNLMVIPENQYFTAIAGFSDATLEIIENQPILETINQRGKSLMNGIGDILTEADIPHVITGVPSMFGILLGKDQEPREFRDYLAGDGELYEAISMGLNRRGVQPDADGREPWFLCYSLSEEDVSETLNAFNDSVKEAKEG